jgi:predicted TIM-barrel fold metal-dependent hydrolase
MIVDIHTHIWDSPDQLGEDATERIRRLEQAPWEQPNASPEAFDRAMAPVAHAIVHGFVSARLGAKIGSQQVAACVRRNPEKYVGFAGIDPMMDGYLDELSKAVDLGLSGVNISPSGQGFHPSHSRSEALYEQCQKQNLPIMIHPGSQFTTKSIMQFARPYLYDQVSRDFPGLKIILAQIGHPWIDETLTLIGKHANVWADVSDLVLRPWPLYNALLAAHEMGVMDRLFMGSDFPFCTPEKAIMTIYSVNTYTQGTHQPGVPREQLRGMVERDTLACLGIQPGRSEPDTPQTGGIVEPPAQTVDVDRPSPVANGTV